MRSATDVRQSLGDGASLTEAYLFLVMAYFRLVFGRHSVIRFGTRG